MKVLAVAIAGWLITFGLASAAEVTIPANTRVFLENLDELVAKGDQVQVGQTVRARVWRDVVVDGRIVIPAGSPATAQVDMVKKRKVAGIKGKMSIKAMTTYAAGNQPVQLTGGYNKQGKGRIALSASLAALVCWPCIFIPGSPAQLPAGAVFDAYTAYPVTVQVEDRPLIPKINLTQITEPLSAELLYDELAKEDKPKWFLFEITVQQGVKTEFSIDRINSESIEPLRLQEVSVVKNDDVQVVRSQIKIKKLLKQFRKGLNTIEIAGIDENGKRVADEILVDIEI